MDAEFFKGFTADLHNKKAWNDFHTKFRKEKRLKDLANPTQLGDPVSLKAEAADSHPTDDDLGAQSSQPSPQPSDSAQNNEKPSLSKLAKNTTIGDPISLESEEVVETSPSPPSNSPSTPQPTEPIVAPSPTSTTSSIPPLPSIDGESLFWTMMSPSRSPDPYIFPALQRLHTLSPRPILAALSNTVIYPPDHPWSNPSPTSFNPRHYFDISILSAEVHMRKPSRDIYLHTIHTLSSYSQEKFGTEIKAEDIVFLDDIGENLKMGREVGMRTVRVVLGRTWRAVKELEKVLGGGVELMDERVRRAKL